MRPRRVPWGRRAWVIAALLGKRVLAVRPPECPLEPQQFGAAAGGPAQLFRSRGAFGGAAVRPDYGQALVELIQSTIDPDFWDIRGGPGTIVYYAPLHALVVRATSEVHHKIGGAVKVIRQVGN